MFQQLLERVARALDARSISYMIIGGQAVLLYGEPRLTRDIDIALGLGPEHWSDITGIASAEGWQVLVQSPDAFVRETMVLPCLDTASGTRLDFVFSQSSYEQEALDRAQSIKIGATFVRYASVEDVIVHKIIAGRARDLDDVQSMLLKNPDADRTYIRRWLGEFQSSLGEQFLQRFDDLAGGDGDGD